MHVRPVTESDAPVLLEFWNRSVRFDPLTPALLAEKLWQDEGFDPALALVAEREGKLAGFILGVVRQRADGPMGFVKLMVVDMAQRRHGVAGSLLRELEARLAQRGVRVMRVGESAPNYLTPGLDVRHTNAMLFFEKHGYERVGQTYNLEVDLAAEDFSTDAHEAKLAAEGIEFRRAASGDESAVMELLTEHWAAWMPEVKAGFRNSPISVHLAWMSGAPVGFAAYDCNNRGTGWFGPMGTAPEARSKGIGAVLLRRCLHDLKAQGRATAVIPWVGPIAFYAR
ncbi:MAG: GNAT family N-acetyltransferase, partial [Verrucomicrobiota bacterium]